MAKSSQALLVAALCFFALLGVSHCHDKFYVQGKVYCDTCRALFETRVSEYMAGAKVRLQCRGREAGNVTYTVEGNCDAAGTYNLAVEGDHEEEICEVTVLKSTIPGCDEAVQGRTRARVLLTTNNGIVSDTRTANALSFLKREALPICPQVFRELGVFPSLEVFSIKN